MVPVIRLLKEQGHEVILAADERPLAFLREQFPELRILTFPGYRVSYPAGNNFAIHLIRQFPGLLRQTWREHRAVKEMIRENQIDVVISDNRIGLWSGKAYSIYVTHQLNIKAPKGFHRLEPLFRLIHRMIIRKYDECWIPDLPGTDNLSGGLSHHYSLPANTHYVGLLSRFSDREYFQSAREDSPGPDMLVMLSGPEPQRSILEEMILRDLDKEEDREVIVLRGLPGQQKFFKRIGKHSVYNHLDNKEITALIRNAGTIVCRSGYSTLMDLAVLGRSAVLVATPGQTEQEYLAVYLKENGRFASVPQSGFSLAGAFQLGKTLTEANYNRMDISRNLLESRVSALDKRVNEK
jgi:UDP:flavonoid glycosyltransferase YjiC (YdhE family)